MNSPTISIIIATYNSERSLEKVLDSIETQQYPSKKVEKIIVDGGSTDKTIEIAKKHKCTMIHNYKVEPVNAKYLGYKQARGEFVLYLDHDEVINNSNSFQKKLEAFYSDENIFAVIGSGYVTPKKYPKVNYYINEFGDPFSFFIYKLSKDYRFFIKTMKKRYSIIKETKDFIVLSFPLNSQVPLIELVAGGSMINYKKFNKSYPQVKKSKELLPHLFYLLKNDNKRIAITKDDTITHYSADKMSKYLNKILWRIKNNIYHVKDMGAAGFTGRQIYEQKGQTFKKYLFLPYAFTIILPLFDSLYLCISRKNNVYLIHLPLTIFTALMISYHLIIRSMGKNRPLKSYDETFEIS